MAHLRVHPNSKFWYLRFRDLDTGKWREESTHLLREDTQQTREAQRLADKRTASENQLRGPIKGAFREWVADFIRTHYTRESTRRRAEFAWERVAEWLNTNALRHPREIRYEHGRQYLEWRRPDTAHNTALAEVHFLAFILNEAIRREYAERNVLAKLGIGREPAKIKPELTDAQMDAARVAFRDRGWMRVACEIQIYTGCRISETSIALTDLNFAKLEMTMTDAKRKLNHPKKRYTVPLPDALLPTLRRCTGDRTLPLVTTSMEARYNEVLRAATGTTSHSFRVTFITRCRDAGIEERDAMALVNHSRREVHAIYARTDARRLTAVRARLELPPPLVRETPAPSGS